MADLTQRASRYGVVLVVSLALVSCAGPREVPSFVVPLVRVHGTAATTAVGSIHTANGSVLPPQQLEVIERHGTRQRLQNELTRQLLVAGRFGEGGELHLTLDITEFRLRSESNVRWLGAMAGPDLLGVKVHVVKNGMDVSTFETGVSTTIALSARYVYEDARLVRMAEELSRRIIAKLPPSGG